MPAPAAAAPASPYPAHLLPALLLLLFASAAASPANRHEATTANAPTLPAHYIVTFDSYEPIARHESTVRTILALTPPTDWRLLPRPNVAATLPTDFVVLETPHHHLRARLASSAHVRTVAPQGTHLRAPKAVRLRLPTDAADGGAAARHTTATRHPFRAGALWRRGYTGQRVSVAVFDTGLIGDQTHFRNVASLTDWTAENTTRDHVGHGTFVAGLIAGTHPSCPGLAPDVDLHVFRVFTAAQVSYTSWFLDAFNYALHIGVDVLNLSIGGPDFADSPFTEKVDELAAHGVVVVSAIGNDGPLWGSLNNPGDMMAVVGVGGAEPDGRVASFSSRGMTTHELEHPAPSYGRVKPDIVAYARSLVGPSHRAADRCRRLSGTSVASPVVAGAIALLASAVPLSRRRHVVNPASIKRALAESARRLRDASVYEQGAGLLDIEGAYEEMVRIDREFVDAQRLSSSLSSTASPSTASSSEGSVARAALSLRRMLRSVSGDHAPNANASAVRGAAADALLSTPAVYATAPLDSGKDGRRNATAHKGKAVSGRRLFEAAHAAAAQTEGPAAAFFPSFYDLRAAACPHMWPHCAQALFKGALAVTLNVTILNAGGVQGSVASVAWEPGRNGELLDVSVSVPQRFWPWAAGMGIHLSTSKVPQVQKRGGSTIIDAEGILHVRVVSVHENTRSDIALPIRASIIAPPAREKRLLWDMQHSIRYPPGYVPRDNLAETKDMLDWLGDHPHTNFHALFRELVAAGYHVDVLDRPLMCLGAERAATYGALLVLDSEDEFSADERALVERLVKEDGMALVVAAEWYNVDVMREIRFEDDNTRSWWSPVVGGGNVPALNALLAAFDIGLGDDVFSGEVRTGASSFRFESGVSIVRFPAGGELLMASGLRLHDGKAQGGSGTGSGSFSAPVAGLAKAGLGSVAVYGDTNCVDTAYGGPKCYSFFISVISGAVGCAGQARCARVARNGQISRGGLGLDGAQSGGGRLAQTMPDEMAEMFRPHSRSAGGGARARDVCVGRARALQRVGVVRGGGGGGGGGGSGRVQRQRQRYGGVRTTSSSGDGSSGGAEAEGRRAEAERRRAARAAWLLGVGCALVWGWGMWRCVWRCGRRRVRGPVTSGRRARARRAAKTAAGGVIGKVGGARALVGVSLNPSLSSPD